MDRITGEVESSEGVAVGKNIRQTVDGRTQEINISMRPEDVTRWDIFIKVENLTGAFYDFREEMRRRADRQRADQRTLYNWLLGVTVFVVAVTIFGAFSYQSLSASIAEIQRQIENIQNYLPTPTPFPWEKP